MSNLVGIRAITATLVAVQAQINTVLASTEAWWVEAKATCYLLTLEVTSAGNTYLVAHTLGVATDESAAKELSERLLGLGYGDIEVRAL